MRAFVRLRLLRLGQGVHNDCAIYDDLVLDFVSQDPKIHKALDILLLAFKALDLVHSSQHWRLAEDGGHWKNVLDLYFLFEEEIGKVAERSTIASALRQDSSVPLLVAKGQEDDAGFGLRKSIQRRPDVPELCSATGLTDKMRFNFTIMRVFSVLYVQPFPKKFLCGRAITDHTQINPEIHRKPTIACLNSRHAGPELMKLLTFKGRKLARAEAFRLGPNVRLP